MSKISELTDGGSLLPTDFLIAVRSGGNVKVKADQADFDRIRLGDNEKIELGNSQDLTLVHTATQSIINQAGTGDLLIQKAGTTKASITANGLEFPDNSKAIFGAGSDLQIYSDGTTGQVTGNVNVTGTVTANGLTVDTDTLVVDATNNRVGIGTSSPLSKLNAKGTQGNWRIDPDSVSGEIQVFSTTTANDGFRDFRIRTQQTIFDTGGTESMRINPNGKVGIGISPQSFTDLMVNTATDRNISIFDNATGATIGGLTDAGASAALRLAGSPLIFTGNGGSGAEAMRIDASGNVSIGNTVASSMDGGANNLVIGSGSGTEGMTIYSGTTNSGTIYFADGSSGDDRFRGQIGYSHSDNSLSFRTNASSSSQMTLDSSGNVGIGVSSMVNPLHVGVTPNTASKTSGSAFDGGALRLDGNLDNTGAESAILAGSNGSLSAGIGFMRESGSTWGTALKFYTHSPAITTTDELTERMRLDASGNLLVGTSSASGSGASSGKQVTQFNGAIGNGLYVDDTRTAAGTDTAIIFGRGATITGSITTTLTTTAYVTSSDQRLKENIADADDAGSKIDAIQVRKFDWKVDGSHQDYGMVAQELLEVAPEAVSAPEDSEEMMGVDYSKLVPMMLKEIQSLRARVAQLES